MTDDQIKYMVKRFLGWRLPENFSPDAGISFKRTFNDHLPVPMKHEPMGTNLFDDGQASQMVQYMVDGLPAIPADNMSDILKKKVAEQQAAILKSQDGIRVLRAALVKVKPIVGAACAASSNKSRPLREAAYKQLCEALEQTK